MQVKVALAQVSHPADGNVIGLVERTAEQAAKQGVKLLCFPEGLMAPWDPALGCYAVPPEPLYGPYCKKIDEAAATNGLWLLYYLNEARPDGNPYNTAVLTGPDGARRLAYRKTHLFDVGDIRESHRLSAGDAPSAPVKTPFATIGIATCYELRFPEIARQLALAGCDLLIYPAAWVAGPHKADQWETLLKARAIENEAFVLGVCRPDSGCIGNSRVVAPDGTVLAAAGSGEELLACDLDMDQVATIRSNVPVFVHRRPELY
ncbi:MAG: nitrilase-related carbon-nitrogen hydrolase [Tractidigestivibacter sp.]|jgi:predicted amidohydrolase|uniref:nitrilase-related carbon-nitrogen hydrolase n=1 Tax=Tractidigestivibacter sp. TaxID=2847320 RepID=UPI003D94B555